MHGSRWPAGRVGNVFYEFRRGGRIQVENSRKFYFRDLRKLSFIKQNVSSIVPIAVIVIDFEKHSRLRT